MAKWRERHFRYLLLTFHTSYECGRSTIRDGIHIPPGRYESEDALMMWGYGLGWGWLMMSLGTILWFAILVVLVWALIRWLNNRTSTQVPPPPSGMQSEPTAL